MTAPRLPLFRWAFVAFFLMLGLGVRAQGVPPGLDADTPGFVDPKSIPIQKPVIPEREPREPLDKDRVLYFFSFDCTFCMANDRYFWQWGLSLPEPIEFVPVPVIAGGDNAIIMARGYYAAELTDRVLIAYFMAEVYALIQTRAADPKKLETYMEAARSVGMDTERFEKNWNGNQSMRALIDARKRFTHYQPDSTPSLLINGKYLVGPDLTNGDYQLFFQLANGLLSQYLESTGNYSVGAPAGGG